jgi:membrane protein implicated in regulation of membrane protease activity
MIPLYVFAVIGLVVMPRRIAVLFVALLVYNTLAALMFAGATRYRVPWDFVLALAAGAAVVWLLDRRRKPPVREADRGKGSGGTGRVPQRVS